MDTKTLILETRARFTHNAFKASLKEKYDSKLIVASQNGLWKANLETINFLNSTNDDTIILIDTFGNPVEVNREELLSQLKEVYTEVMKNWYAEYKESENIR